MNMKKTVAFVFAAGMLIAGALQAFASETGSFRVSETQEGIYGEETATEEITEIREVDEKDERDGEKKESCEYETTGEPASAHTHDGMDFLPWGEGEGERESLPAGAGNYCLTVDIKLDETWETPDGTINLCLNGRSITLTGETGSVIRVKDESVFNLYDCKETGRITGGKGTLKKSRDVRISGGVLAEGVFNMYGGFVSGNEAVDGGGVYIYDGGVFNMYGGSITDNRAGNCGGGVYAENNEFNMYDGCITQNSAGWGGGVYVSGIPMYYAAHADSSVYGSFGYGEAAIYGGKIKDNGAREGGGIYNAGSLNIEGGEISENSSIYDGGGITNEYFLNIAGGKITGNRCSCGGGGISTGYVLWMHGGEITDNYAEDGGGIDCGGSVVVTGGRITGNVASERGGGINNAERLTMIGGEITGNTADLGGGVYSTCSRDNDPESFRIGKTVKVTGNRAVSAGSDNVSLHGGSRFTFCTGEDAPEDGMQIGVTLLNDYNYDDDVIRPGYSPADTTCYNSNYGDIPPVSLTGRITNNGTAEQAAYMIPDNDEYLVRFKTDHLELFRRPSSDRSGERTDPKPFFTGTRDNAVADGTWSQDADGAWHYRTNAEFCSTWGYILNPYAKEGQNKADWFWFDAQGNMLTGWQCINGKWYYLNPVGDGTCGACLIGPGRTPDGYEIDAEGAWTGR